MSNATSLQVYVDGFDRYMLKAKAFMIDDEKIFERILNHLTLIIDLLKDNSYSSKREFYYSDKDLFEYKQQKPNSSTLMDTHFNLITKKWKHAREKWN
ncbi:hypothetical protein P8452_54009 [Trifolium repens]|nr:hypothetical protein P8452_54009 [Trifolium repens]